MINSVIGNSDLDSPKQMQIRRPSQNSGESRDPPLPLFLDQTEARRAEKIWGETAPPPPPLSQGLDPALQNMCTDKTAVNFGVEL